MDNTQNMRSSEEQQLEQQLADKGLAAPRVTSQEVDDQVMRAEFHRFEGTTTTVCLMTLRNGFTVVGQSACASPENFDAKIGQGLAYTDARNQVWNLQGYLLKDRLFQAQRTTNRGKLARQAVADFKASNPLTVRYIGTKHVDAAPMTRQAYNDLRGWELPADECGEDAGYLVEYVDGGKPNVEGFNGYVSWSPKDVFERSYVVFGLSGEETFTLADIKVGDTVTGAVSGTAGAVYEHDAQNGVASGENEEH